MKEQTIFKSAMESHFTSLPNALLRDKTLTFKARGVLAMIHSNTKEWVITRKWLEDQGPDSKGAIKSAMRELELAGYAVFKVLRNDDGVFTVRLWTFYAEPVPEDQRTHATDPQPAYGNPEAGNPEAGSPASGDTHPSEEHGTENHEKEETVTEVPAEAGADEDVSSVITGKDHADLIAWWCTDFMRRIKSPYKVNGGRDGKAVKQLLQHFKNLDAVQRFITACLHRSSEFPFNGMTGTLHRFAENISTFQSALATPPKTNGRPVAPRGVPVAANELPRIE